VSRTFRYGSCDKRGVRCPSTARFAATVPSSTPSRSELACEVTLQPVRRYGVDAAILFSDIVVPYHAIGFGVDVVPGRGPVVAQPFAGRGDLERLRDLGATTSPT